MVSVHVGPTHHVRRLCVLGQAYRSFERTNGANDVGIDLRDEHPSTLAPLLDARGMLRTLPFAHGLEAFFAALREGRTPTPGPEDALETLRLAVAATKSWRERRPVKISEITA